MGQLIIDRGEAVLSGKEPRCGEEAPDKTMNCVDVVRVTQQPPTNLGVSQALLDFMASDVGDLEI